MAKYRFPGWFHELQLSQFPDSDCSSPLGKMSQYLGEKHSWQTLYDEDYYDSKDIPKLKRIRAYSISRLVGQKIQVFHQNQISTAMYELIRGILPEMDWEPFELGRGAFQKYYIVHFDIPAPPDELTQQPMGLEIYAKLATVDGNPLDSEAGRAWMDERYLLRMKAERAEQEWPELTGNFEVVVKTATYSNIRYPGVGVPLYS